MLATKHNNQNYFKQLLKSKATKVTPSIAKVNPTKPHQRNQPNNDKQIEQPVTTTSQLHTKGNNHNH